MINMQIISIIFIVILGLVFGSFLSVFTFRLPKKINFVKGRSYCPRCKNKISWFDNIPLLSYLLLKGKCRNCKNKISIRYPLIEISTSLFWLLIYLTNQGNLLNTIVYFIFYLIVASIFIIDFEEGIIPDELTFIGFAISFLYILFFNNNKSFEHLLGGFSLASLMLLIHLVTKGKGMGLGDVKFTLFPATFLIFPYNFLWFILSFIIGSIVGIILMLFKKAKFGKPIAFGPFLAFSFIIILLWGENIVRLLGV